jgi:hypothetical protein
MRITPSIFIGSSSEFVHVAKDLEARLKAELGVNATVWDDPSVFRLGQNNMDSILTAPHFFDYSILILGPDDLVTSRGKRTRAPRDNVIFELGFFLGSQGRKRAFAMVLERPSKNGGKRPVRIKIPSDLAGEQFVPVVLTGRNQASAAGMADAVNRIGQALENQRNLSYITPLPSTVLAVTYYKNFLHPMCDTLLRSDIVVAGMEKPLQPRKDGFTVTVAIPKSLDKASRSGQEQYKRKNQLDLFTIDNDARPFPFFISLKRSKDGLQFFDVPTTLRGCSEAIRLLLPNPGAVGKSKEQELVERREIENFAETLQHIIETDLDGQHLKHRIKLKFW